MRRFLAILLTSIIVSCTTDSNTYTITGEATGFEDNTPIYVYTIENSQPKVLDTLLVTKGKFFGEYAKSEESTVNYFYVEKPKANLLFFPENENMQVTIYKDSIQSSFVKGGVQNDQHTEFTRKIRGFNDTKKDNMKRFNEARSQRDEILIQQIRNENTKLLAEESAYKKEFVKSHNNSLFSIMLLSEMMTKREFTPKEVTEIIEKFSPKMAASSLTSDLKKAVSKMAQAEVGSVAPQFSAATPQGGPMSLNDALGKYTIIDFWASWCRPCRAENPNVVRVYNKYHDKGLNIISVSLDKKGQKARWLKAIEDDKMDWFHVSNLAGWQDRIAKMYNVRSIPATFLLDEEGKIIAKNLRGPALETKIASLLGP